MSISKGAFGQSSKGGFIESRLGARGWGGVAAVWVGTRSTTASQRAVVAYDLDGNKIWEYLTGGDVTATETGRMERDDTYLYVPVVRNNTYQGTEGDSASILKIRLSTGQLVQTFDTGGNINSTAVDSAGNVYAAGQSSVTWPGSAGVAANVFKFDADGNVLWAYSTSPSQAYGIVRDHEGNVFVCGELGFGLNNVWKLNGATGALIADDLYGGSVTALAIDCSGTGVVYARIADSTFNIYGLSNALGAHLWRADFDSFTPTTCALGTTPESCLIATNIPTLVQVELGTSIDALNTSGSVSSICRQGIADEPGCYFTEGTNVGKADGTLAQLWNVPLLVGGVAVNATAIVSELHHNFTA